MKNNIPQTMPVTISREEEIKAFEAIYNNLSTGITLATKEGTLRYANAAFHNILEYEAGSLRNIPFEEITHPDDVSRSWADLQNLVKGRIPNYTTEKRYITSKGEVVWCQLNVSPIRSKGQFKLAVAIIENIQYEKDMERRARRNADLLDKVLNGVSIGMEAFKAVRNEQGVIEDFEFLQCNEAARQMVPLKEKLGDDIIGKKLCELFPGVRETNFKDYVKVVETGEPFETENHYAHEGMDIWFHQVVNKLDDGFVISFQDISQRINTELSLRESEAKYAGIFRNSAVGMCMVDLDGRILKANRAMVNLLGYREKELTQMKFEEFTFPDDVKTDLNLFEELKADKRKNYRIEKRYFTKNGEVTWADLWVSLVKDEAQKPQYAIALVQDINKRKQAQNDNLELFKSMESKVEERTSQLKAAVDELQSFSYSVSHDLRAPLRAIAGYTSILKEDYLNNFDKEGEDILNYIIDNSHKMGQLIDDLLAYSRMQRKVMNGAKLDLNEVVKSVTRDLIVANEGLNIQFKIDKLPQAYGDPTLIQLVMQNLVGNAIKFSSKREVVQIEIAAKKKENEIEVMVKDNGVGFDMKYYDKIFGIFQRLHGESEFSGTGVGLALVQRIIRKHEGKVWAESEIGEGAAFYFTLPIKRSEDNG